MGKDKSNGSFFELLSGSKAAPQGAAQGKGRILRQAEIPGTGISAMAEKQTDLVERVLSPAGLVDADQARVDLKALSGILEGLSKKTVVVIFAMGKVLTEVKALLPHGEFIPWVEGNCPFARRTSQNYMCIYERYQHEPRRALEELSISEAYIEAGVKRLMAPGDDEKAKLAGDGRISDDGLPVLEDYKHLFKKGTASGIPLKRYRVVTHANGTIYAMSMEMGMMPVCNLYVNNAIDNPEYHDTIAQVHKDICLALEAFYSRLEDFEDKGVIHKPFDLRMGALMRAARNVTPEKPVKKSAKKPAGKVVKKTAKKGGRK